MTDYIGIAVLHAPSTIFIFGVEISYSMCYNSISLIVDIFAEGKLMAVSYKKLWHILLDKGMMKKDLEELAGVSHYTVTQLGKNKHDDAPDALTGTVEHRKGFKGRNADVAGMFGF